MFKPSSEIIVKADFIMSPNQNFKNIKHHVAVNGEGLVSKQELEIYEFLLEQENLIVGYELPFEGKEKTLYPDFTVTNIVTQRTFVWEHLGMTNNEKYLDKIPQKIKWYRDNGLETIEKGGNFIISFYQERTFFKDVSRFVSIILEK